MPTFIVKAEPDTDLYVLWSTVVDAPTFTGTRAEVTQHLAWQDGNRSAQQIEQRFARADAHGSSGIPPFNYGTWDGDPGDGDLMYQQQGFIRRHNFPEYAARLRITGDPDPGHLLDPFEDDDEAATP